MMILQKHMWQLKNTILYHLDKSRLERGLAGYFYDVNVYKKGFGITISLSHLNIESLQCHICT